MVECEYNPPRDVVLRFENVLIDTWWNVNKIYIHVIFLSMCVLIDTWWNVNELYISAVFERIGFNRYMVECELTYNLIFLSTDRF